MASRVTGSSDARLVAVGQASNALVSAASVIVTARALGPIGRGDFTVLQSVTALAVALGIIGVPTYIVRAAHLAPEERTRGLVLAAAMLSGCLGGALLLGYLHAARGVSSALGRHIIACLVAVVIGAVIQACVEALAAQHQAASRFRTLVLTRLLCMTAPIALMAVAAGIKGQAVFAFEIGVLVTAISLAVSSTLTLPHRGDRKWKYRAVRFSLENPILKSSLQSHASYVLLLFVYRLDVVLLGILAGSAAVGIYSITYAAAEIAWLYTNGHSIAMMPRLVTAPYEVASSAIKAATIQSMMIAAVVCGVGALVGYPLIREVLGADYSQSYFAFLAIIPGVFAFIPFKLRATFTVASGKASRLAWVCLLLVALNVAANAALDPRLSAVGAAAASTLTYVAGWLLMLRRPIP